ncbi:uncharacterized protein GIQ15_02893 [Arthroderma uncinatum]|uniref:uncharacterized protein n=1 Tax=Arthroderma uncinatum TaxID=74035 RepID=UPI00144A8108|nr:uncharacterized protein GIQ15_02893 [Arthroderma uncinatum]KAF3483569.1 hypothetical protein GIQ15_02893 [Arthroderma uncinatum]
MYAHRFHVGLGTREGEQAMENMHTAYVMMPANNYGTEAAHFYFGYMDICTNLYRNTLNESYLDDCLWEVGRGTSIFYDLGINNLLEAEALNEYATLLALKIDDNSGCPEYNEWTAMVIGALERAVRLTKEVCNKDDRCGGSQDRQMYVESSWSHEPITMRSSASFHERIPEMLQPAKLAEMYEEFVTKNASSGDSGKQSWHQNRFTLGFNYFLYTMIPSSRELFLVFLFLNHAPLRARILDIPNTGASNRAYIIEPLVSPPLPEREVDPRQSEEDDSGDFNGMETPPSERSESTDLSWTMPRTGMSLPNLPDANDISSYLTSKVLTADDVRSPQTLLHRVSGMGQLAEVLYILRPLIYAIALQRYRAQKKSWTPWLIGFGMEFTCRQLAKKEFRDRIAGGLRGLSKLEREELSKRGWSMGWWAMRGAFYENITKSWIKSVTDSLRDKPLLGLVGSVVEDYEYLWDNYYFSTATM